MASQVDATSPPSGVVAPSPVTTTSVVLMSVVRLDEGDGVAHGLEVLDLVVGDLDAELLLGGHHDLDHGQRVDVQVVGERLLLGDVVRVHAGDLLEDLGEAGCDLSAGCHVRWFLSMVGKTHGPVGCRLHGQRTTCPAYVRPPPKPKSRTGAPEGTSRRSTSFDRASGTLAAEVLPDPTRSLATTTSGPRPSRFTMPSMMRVLAWCGMKAASSSGRTPAFSQVSSANGARAVVAQRKTIWPSCWMYGCQPSIRSTSPLSGAEPQSTGPTPGSSPSATPVTTAAPAPSPNRTAVLRSVQSVTSDSFSAPITSA